MRKIVVKTLIKLFDKLKKRSQEAYYGELREKYSIHPTFKFNGSNIKFYGKGIIQIGASSYLGENAYIQSVADQSVTIGENCALSHNIRIYTSSYKSDQNFNITGQRETYSESVSIGNGVWIGANVLINPGIEIEDNVIVGANAVVTKKLLANGIYGGVPAKLIRFKNIV